MWEHYVREMRYLTSAKEPLLGAEKPLEEADYVAFGVPYDLTSSFRPGSRYGPEAVRKFSANLEPNSYVRDYDSLAAPVYDAGNLVFDYRLSVMLKRTYRLVNAIRALGKKPIMIGGEHTFTLAAVLAFKSPKLSLIVLDAHLDLREEYCGLRLSHATYLRRLRERRPEHKISVIGVRGYDKSEIDYATNSSINIIYSRELSNPAEVSKRLEHQIADGDIYISLDIDVLDPAYAPGVGNPEPGGLSVSQLIDIIHEIAVERVVGFDVMEVSPLFDTGATAAAASRLIVELLAAMSGARRL